MAFWRVSVLLLFVSVLVNIVHGQHNLPHQHHGSGMATRYEIVARIYSGKPNPEVIIQETAMSPEDKKIIEDVKNWHDKQKPTPEFKDILGYKGFSLLHKDDADNVLHAWNLPKCENITLEETLARLFPLNRQNSLLKFIEKCKTKTV